MSARHRDHRLDIPGYREVSRTDRRAGSRKTRRALHQELHARLQSRAADEIEDGDLPRVIRTAVPPSADELAPDTHVDDSPPRRRKFWKSVDWKRRNLRRHDRAVAAAHPENHLVDAILSDDEERVPLPDALGDD